MVLCGHRGHIASIDRNRFGHEVYQLMSNYQSRGQTAKAAARAGRAGGPVGDGWLRLMTFDMSAGTPALRVRTYSSHYRRFSTEVPEYAAWYKPDEAPQLSDAAFHARDDFAIPLTDFRQRFGAPRRER